MIVTLIQGVIDQKLYSVKIYITLLEYSIRGILSNEQWVGFSLTKRITILSKILIFIFLFM